MLSITSSIFAGGYVKPDQWGGFNGKDDKTGEIINTRPDNWGGFEIKKGDKRIQMKPDKYGGYQCTEYDRNYKKSGSFHLKPDGYGGYKSDDKNINVKKDKYGTYKW